MAEVAIPRGLFRGILARIRSLAKAVSNADLGSWAGARPIDGQDAHPTLNPPRIGLSNARAGRPHSGRRRIGPGMRPSQVSGVRELSAVLLYAFW